MHTLKERCVNRRGIYRMELIRNFTDKYLSYLPSLKITDVIEILIISFVVYHIMVWIKNTKAWSLMKGVICHDLYSVCRHI